MKMVMGIFDVHMTNHQWRGDRAIKLDAYMMLKHGEGDYTTYTDDPLASLLILAGPFDFADVWIGTKETEKIDELPPFVQHAYSAVVASAREAQKLFPIDVK